MSHDAGKRLAAIGEAQGRSAEVDRIDAARIPFLGKGGATADADPTDFAAASGSGHWRAESDRVEYRAILSHDPRGTCTQNQASGTMGAVDLPVMPPIKPMLAKNGTMEQALAIIRDGHGQLEPKWDHSR